MLKISDLFPVPSGVVDVRIDPDSIPTEEIDGDDSVEEPDTSGNAVVAPTDFEVVSQRVRYMQDGTAVVDVTIQFDEEDEDVEYEVRVFES